MNQKLLKNIFLIFFGRSARQCILLFQKRDRPNKAFVDLIFDAQFVSKKKLSKKEHNFFVAFFVHFFIPTIGENGTKYRNFDITEIFRYYM
jgi:hypothetical protein